MRILTVIVTFNRRQLLSRCIEGVIAQTSKPEGILVINNGSTDGTEKMLAASGIMHINQENVGSAGGWHRGIRHALENAYDAVWLMDDDGYPDQEALGLLRSYIGNGVVCASSVVLKENSTSDFVFPFPLLDEAGLPVVIEFPRKLHCIPELSKLAPDGTYPFAHLFNGALVSTDAIRRIGNVNVDYFIFGDEVDFFFRLRESGKVVSVVNARHFHPDVSERPYTPAKVYYYLKNTLILNSRYFNYVLIRNAMAIIAVLARTLKRNGAGMMLSLLAGSNAKAFYSAIFRGLRGKIGKDFNA